MKSKITEMKNSLEGFNVTLKQVEGRIGKLENSSTEISQPEEQNEEKWRAPQRFCQDTGITRAPERKERAKEAEYSKK